MKMLIYNKKLQYYNIIKIFKSALKCTAVYHLLNNKLQVFIKNSTTMIEKCLFRRF